MGHVGWCGKIGPKDPFSHSVTMTLKSSELIIRQAKPLFGKSLAKEIDLPTLPHRGGAVHMGTFQLNLSCAQCIISLLCFNFGKHAN